MTRSVSRLLILMLLMPSFTGLSSAAATEAPTYSAYEPYTGAVISTASPAPASSASMTPEMQDMMACMEQHMDSEAMRLHMELMSPEMKEMMSQMMSASPDATSTPGSEHDHSGHSQGSAVHRFGQPSLAERAVALSRSTYETGTVRSAVLANGARFDDTLAASSLAGSLGAPLLPATGGAVSSAVVTELKRLGVRKVYIVGGTGHVSASVQTRLSSLGFSVSRVAGADRNATAGAVARKVASIRGTRTLSTVFVVSSDRPWDALTVSPYAYAKKTPVLFVNGSGIPGSTLKALRDLRVRHVIVVSSGVSVKNSTYRALSRVTSGGDAWIGADTRWALADKMARYAVAETWVTAAHPVFAKGTDSPSDALIAGSHAGAKGSVLLLSPSTALPRTARVFLVENRSVVNHPVVVGTTTSIEDAVLLDIASLLQGTSH